MMGSQWVMETSIDDGIPMGDEVPIGDEVPVGAKALWMING